MAPALIESLGWESVFYLFGAAGIVWCYAFNQQQPVLPADPISTIDAGAHCRPCRGMFAAQNVTRCSLCRVCGISSAYYPCGVETSPHAIQVRALLTNTSGVGAGTSENGVRGSLRSLRRRVAALGEATAAEIERERQELEASTSGSDSDSDKDSHAQHGAAGHGGGAFTSPEEKVGPAKATRRLWSTQGGLGVPPRLPGLDTGKEERMCTRCVDRRVGFSKRSFVDPTHGPPVQHLVVRGRRSAWRVVQAESLRMRVALA